MTRFPISATVLLLAAAAPVPVAAQPGAIVQPLTPTADRLSEQMRILGRSPTDLSALIEAGRLSGRLGDTDAALQFLARAERVSAGDPRIRAARGATLVTMERPGEALALFESAERAGLAMASYAPDRGLAYDLLGFQPNAQREYRLALAQGDDDEVTRRLALSMGISGDVAGATALLDRLLRANDRAAWRVRACVLAMAGDAAGADRIAASMLPGFGPSLAPFFRRLPQLSAADRAFAVHFGRLAPTPERLADARLAPAITPLPRAVVPVAVAAVAAPRVVARAPGAAQRRAEQRRRTELDRVAQANEARRLATERAQLLAKARADETARVAALARAQAEQAQRTRDAQLQAEQARLAEATRIEATRIAARDAEQRRVAAAALAARDLAAQAPVQVAAAPVPQPVAEPPVAVPDVAAATPPPVAPGFSTVAPAAGDDVLARIIRNLDIPAAELGVGPPVAAPVSALATDAQAARAAAQAREDADRAAEARRAADAKKLADAKAAVARKAAEARQLAEDRKAEAAARAAEAKKAADERKADPERHWVQVAGGANVADLPRAWRALAAKTPALKGRQAWTTPLRATNRLLTGPFDSDDAAQAFVNTLGKGGLSAFTFTSPKGQKVARVPAS